MGKHLKIVVTGPESSGKSMLCAALSRKMQAPKLSEYARHYLGQKGPDYDFTDFIAMYRGHLQQQELGFKDSQTLIFLDTDSINYQVWAEFVYGYQPAFIRQQMFKEKDHHYLLCYPDLPWQEDPLRENRRNRYAIFARHLHWIAKLQRPYAIIRGEGQSRIENAFQACQKWLTWQNANS